MVSRYFSRSLNSVNMRWKEIENDKDDTYYMVVSRRDSNSAENFVTLGNARQSWAKIPTNTSIKLRAKFQEKQIAEKEQKLLALYEARQAKALERVNAPSNTRHNVEKLPQGKVRQMFEERRSRAGIDKSYPLQPISNNNGNSSERVALYRSTSNTGRGGTINSKTKTNNTQTIKPISFNKKHQSSTADTNGKWQDINVEKNYCAYPASTDMNENIEDITFPEELSATPKHRQKHTKDSQPEETSKASLFGFKPNSNIVAYMVKEVKPISGVLQLKKDLKAADSENSKGSKKSIGKSLNENRSDTSFKQNQKLQKSVISKPTPSLQSKTPKTGEVHLVGCKVCGRSFAADRIDRHQEICTKANKKRKPYDALKHRVQGTDAEAYIRRGRGGRVQTVASRKGLAEVPSQSYTRNNNNWRQKHLDFINTIRAAKQAQAHVAAGGNISDLPPPPPSENPDYVQCPHCGRRFNQQAAERHIPKCEHYMYNKPSKATPGAAGKRR